MLTINISKIQQLPKDCVGGSLLDITNTINQGEKVFLSDFFDENELYESALKQYQEFINSIVLNPKVQSFKINKFALYWLTETGSKHPIYHWGKDFFLLLSVLKKSSELIQKEHKKITLIFPIELLHFKKSIEELLIKYHYEINIQLIFNGTTTKKTNLVTILKTALSIIKSILNYQKSESKYEATSQNYYLINSLKNIHTYNIQYLELQKIFNEVDEPLKIIPILEWRSQKTASDATPTEFLDKKPTIRELLSTLFQILKTYFKLSKSNIKPIKIDNINFNGDFLRDDLIKTLNSNSVLIFLNVWLQKFFQTQDGIYFYEDEFYPYGKTISNAINQSNNPKAFSYGIQHGHFNEIHTVYTITDIEIKAGFPLPKKFIVWGEYYRDIFKLNNSLTNNFFLPLGNPKHINTKQPNQKIANNKINNILWCLTSKECFIAEWNIIKNSLILQDTKLIIRLHPLAHISEKEVNNLLKNINFTFSTAKDLINDFNNTDLIITSAHSTIFLDALINQKPVVRIITNRWIGKNDIKSKKLYQASNPEELNDCLNENNQSNSSTAKSKILELDNTKWFNFINEN